jgi:hypothetical protein
MSLFLTSVKIVPWQTSTPCSTYLGRCRFTEFIQAHTQLIVTVVDNIALNSRERRSQSVSTRGIRVYEHGCTYVAGEKTSGDDSMTERCDLEPRFPVNYTTVWFCRSAASDDIFLKMRRIKHTYSM